MHLKQKSAHTFGTLDNEYPINKRSLSKKNNLNSDGLVLNSSNIRNINLDYYKAQVQVWRCFFAFNEFKPKSDIDITYLLFQLYIAFFFSNELLFTNT